MSPARGRVPHGRDCERVSMDQVHACQRRPHWIPIHILAPFENETRYFSSVFDSSPFSHLSGSNFLGSGNRVGL
jgi:hypothetical protein